MGHFPSGLGPTDIARDETFACATLIGDIVNSRKFQDRKLLQRNVGDALRFVNRQFKERYPNTQIQPLRTTVGDEFQGSFTTLAAAVRASMLMRLELLCASPPIDSRFGLGFGEITVFDERSAPISQDGPGWWSARRAIDRSRKLADATHTHEVRTWVAALDSQGERDVARAINAFLLCRDPLITQMRARELRLLRGALLGLRQVDMARSEKVTQPAISTALVRSGANLIIAGQNELEGESS